MVILYDHTGSATVIWQQTRYEPAYTLGPLQVDDIGFECEHPLVQRRALTDAAYGSPERRVPTARHQHVGHGQGLGRRLESVHHARTAQYRCTNTFGPAMTWRPAPGGMAREPYVESVAEGTWSVRRWASIAAVLGACLLLVACPLAEGPPLPPLASVTPCPLHSLAFDEAGHGWGWGHDWDVQLGIGGSVFPKQRVLPTAVRAAGRQLHEARRSRVALPGTGPRRQRVGVGVEPRADGCHLRRRRRFRAGWPRPTTACVTGALLESRGTAARTRSSVDRAAAF